MRDDRRALQALHAARRRRYLSELDWVDALYKTYVTVIVAGAAAFFLSRLFGEHPVSPEGLAKVARDGPAVVGLAIALALTLGLRSGGRGGPLALDAPDVSHVLLAPVRRGLVLRDAARRQVRGVILTGAVLGAIAGNLVPLRLPGERAAWIAIGAVVGVLVALAVWGAALVASGTRLGVAPATAIGLLLVAWSCLDLATGTTTSPTTLLGHLALVPLPGSGGEVEGVAGALLALLVPVAGLALVGGTSLEAAQRRARLVGQLRFAATVQDVRTVIVLHRQLAQQLSRSRPWWRLGAPTGHRPCWRRDWQGIARWPINRLVRQVALGLIAGAALAGVWRGTTALVIVAGIALFLAGLDATEGLAQETDHPGRPAGYPVEWGPLLLRHCVAPAVLVAIVELAGLAVVGGISESTTAVVVSAIVLVPAAAAATAGAAVAVVLGMPSVELMTGFGFPEFGAVLLVLRQVFPPAVAVVAVAPVILAREVTHGASPEGAAASGIVIPIMLVAAIGAWLWKRRLEVA